MQEKKLLIAKKVLQSIKDYYEKRTWGELAVFLGVPEGTLGSWRSRGGMDEDVIIAKCNGINIAWLKTGEGPMFINGDRNRLLNPELRAGLIAEPQTDYSPEIKDLLEIMKRNPKAFTAVSLLLPGMDQSSPEEQNELLKVIIGSLGKLEEK